MQGHLHHDKCFAPQLAGEPPPKAPNVVSRHPTVGPDAQRAVGCGDATASARLERSVRSGSHSIAKRHLEPCLSHHAAKHNTSYTIRRHLHISYYT